MGSIEFSNYGEYTDTATCFSYGTSSIIMTSTADNWYKKDEYTLSASMFEKEYFNKYISYNTDQYVNITTIANDTTQYYLRNDSKFTWNAPVVLTPEERLRQMIRARMAPTIIIRGKKRKSLSIAIDEREERARQTLRRIIGEQGFRKFLRDGFITVVPKSGLTYRIYPGCGFTDVYNRGIMVDRLCVILQGDFPPTDSLIMRYLLILNDEGEFSKFAVKQAVLRSDANLAFPDKQDSCSLVEMWSKMKAVA